MEAVGRPECATVIHNEEASTLTIDYGDGCEGPYGNVLSGKIHVEYHLRNHVSGSYRIVTFEDFYFNGISVEGTRKKTPQQYRAKESTQ